MNAPCAAVVLGVMLVSACASRSARPDPLAERFARTDARKARELAPDLHARAERARADALHAPDGEREARADRELTASLLLEAAIAEGERIASDRAAAAAEARVAGARHARAKLERDRQAIERQIQSEQSARAERAQAARVFGTAAQTGDEAPAGRAAREQAQARDAAFLLRRAQLTLAAALGLGLPEARGAEIAARIAAAESRAPNAGARALTAAQAALHDAERGLGEARALRNPQPDSSASAEETAALIEMAAERGLSVRATARGALFELAPLFAGAAQPTPLGRSRLAQLAAVAAAHPHGAILIEYAAGAQAGGSAEPKARARAARIERELAAATAPARVQLSPAPADAAADAIQVLFSAYRAGP